jgi:sugar-specific transcriptional regulator TrmB
MVNTFDIKEKLGLLGLNNKQANIYLLLLKHGQASLLQLSRLSLINRTTIYRIVEDLKQLNLIEEVLDNRGTKVKAVSPDNLQLLLTKKQTELKTITDNLHSLIQELSAIKDTPTPSTQVVYFRGQSGLKQLLWNILKAKGESVGYGYADWNQSVGREFAEKLRSERVKRKISDREIQNTDQAGPMAKWTNIKNYGQVYQARFLPRETIDIKHDTYIYNDIFAFFSFAGGELFGIEIHNAEIAKTQKQIFEVLWKLAKKV